MHTHAWWVIQKSHSSSLTLYCLGYSICIYLVLSKDCSFSRCVPACGWHAWFLEIAFVCVLVCVCLCAFALKGNNNQWDNMVQYRLCAIASFMAFSNFQLLYMTLFIDKMEGHGLSNTVHHGLQAKKAKLMPY